jgi:hypothetical protein
MSTPAQNAANIANAQSSTGPRTEAGRAASSKNGITNGLYASGDFIRPGEECQHDDLNAALLHELAPVGILEQNLVDEIRRAMWRLRRCGEVEAHLVIGLDDGTHYIFDPMETANAEAEKVQKSVDRARAQSHRLLHKCTAELRKLQTDRQCAKELIVDGIDTADIGIADPRAVAKAHKERTQSEVRRKKSGGLNNVVSIVPETASEAAATEPGTPFTTRTQSVV